MKTKLAICVLLLAGIVSLSATLQSKPTQWEYKFQFQCDEKKANNLAVEGWELVNTTASGSETTAVNCAFKRPKS